MNGMTYPPLAYEHTRLALTERNQNTAGAQPGKHVSGKTGGLLGSSIAFILEADGSTQSDPERPFGTRER
jgi:hypothetical protein